MDCKVSVIIPVYNVESYLRECMDSVVRQTLADIEILCVDDGSTDGSLVILQEYAAKDARVKVLGDGVNHGQAHARNVGLAAAAGEYVYFMDSDDWIDAGALEALVATADAEQLDLLFFSLTAFSDDVDEETLQKKWDYRRKGTYGKKAVSGPEMFAQFGENGDCPVNPVGMLLRRSFLVEKGISFCVALRAYEDNLFYFQSILQAERAMCIPDVYYHRRVRSGSIMTAAFSARNVRAYLLLYEELCKWSMQMQTAETCREAAAGFVAGIFHELEAAMGKLAAKELEACMTSMSDSLFAWYALQHAEKQLDRRRRAAALAMKLRRHPEKTVVLYGAGIWGRRLAYLLDQNGISKFIFAVTDSEEAGKMCLGQAVRSIESILADGDAYQIVIAAGEKHMDAMESYLEAHGCETFFTLRDDVHGKRIGEM